MPIDGNDVLVIDKDNTIVAPYTIGRIAISSYMMMDDYKNQSSEFIFFNDKKYFLMADNGYKDNDNRLYLSNRNSDLNLSLDIYEMVNCVKSKEYIEDAIILPDYKNPNNIFCLVSPCIEKEYIDEIYQSISYSKDYKFRIKSIESIPYSPSGKVRFKEIINIFTS